MEVLAGKTIDQSRVLYIDCHVWVPKGHLLWLGRITMSSMLLSWVYLLCIFSMWCAAHICITTIGATWLQYLFQPILNKRSERQTWNHQQKKAVETHNIFDWWVLARHVPTTDQHGSTKSKAETHHHPSPHHPLPANNQTWRPQQNRFVFQTSSIEQYICYPSVILIKHGNEESWRILHSHWNLHL